MPNLYHYFESGEVSYKRLLIEIQLLKQLKQANLLENLNWTFYDTSALRLFLQEGITEVNDELLRRHRENLNQNDFIIQCIEKHRKFPIKENFKQNKISRILILNTIFVCLCILSIIALFIYEYHHPQRSLHTHDHRLTSKQRHLSFIDDFPIILLTITSGIILGCIIVATRYSWKVFLFGIIALLIIIILLIKKSYEIITFLSKYRELRWPMLYDYMYS